MSVPKPKLAGIVKDAQGMEMIGATVLQKGTNNE